MLFVLIAGGIFGGQTVNAETADGAQGTYSVSPVFSEHQTASVTSFFDVRWSPNNTDKFSVSISNKSDSEKTYKLEVNKARTNKNGIIDYGDQTQEDASVQYQLTKMIVLPKEITIPAQSSQEVAGTISFPSVSFNGILMAGVHVSEKQVDAKQAVVSNTVAYNIPFVVRGDDDVRPKAVLSLKKLTLDKLSSVASSLDVLLTNEKTTLLKASKFTAEITDKQNKSVIKQDSELDLTPETTFTYPVKLPDNLKAGTYHLVLKVVHGKDSFKFKQKFTVTSKEAKVISSRADVNKTPWLLYLIAGILLVVVILIVLIIRRKKATA